MAFALLTLLGLLLRLHGLHQSPWYDEAQTVDLIKLRFGPMLHQIPSVEATPPLYYMLAWLWAKLFGSTVVSLRVFSLVPGLATVPLAGLVATRMLRGNRRAGVIVAALAACSPELIWYSQEIRPYSLMLALSTAGLLAFTYARERQSPARVLTWAVISGLALATHYFSGILVAPEAAVLLYEHRRSRVVWAGIGILVLFLAATAPQLLSENSKLPFGYITVFPLGLRIGQVFSQFLIGQGAPDWSLFKFLAFALTLAAIALLFAKGTHRERRAAVPPLQLAAVGLALPVLAAIVGSDRLITRDLLPIWVPAMVALGACLSVRRARALGIVITIALCAIGTFISLAVVSDTFLQRPDWQAVADVIGTTPPSTNGTHARRVIVSVDNDSGLQLGVYMHGIGEWMGAQWNLRDVSEIDFLVARSPHTIHQPNCWWGSGCQIGPSKLRRREYLVPGFRAVAVRRVRQFTVLELVSDTGAPRSVTRGRIKAAVGKANLAKGHTWTVLQSVATKPYPLK